MSSNVSGLNPSSWKKLPTYGLYFAEGSAMSIGNLVLALCIWYHKALRSQKQYLVVSFMFLADSMNGTAQLFASVYRTSLLFLGIHDVKIARWDCMTKLHSVFWTFSEPCAALMLGVVSFDRLVLVLRPADYIKNNAIIYVAIALPYVWSLCSLGVALYLAWLSPRMPTVEQYCLLSFGHGKSYWAYHGALSVIGSALSIFLFVLMMEINKKRQNQVATTSGGVTEKQILKRQKRLTKSLGYSCVFTFVFFLIPRAVGTAIYYSQLERGLAANLMMILYWIVGNFNALLNIIIFAVRHREVRKGVRCMFARKKLPVDLALWFATPTSAGKTPQPALSKVTKKRHS